MSDLNLTEAVEAGRTAAQGVFPEGSNLADHPLVSGAIYAALTAAAPLIAAQAVADLRARIETLRDATRLTEVIRSVTDTWDEPLDEVHDIPQIVNALIADCVPNLGPSHCHLCSEREGREMPWSEAHPDLRARLETLRDEWQTIADGDDVLDDMDDDYASGDRHGHGRCADALDALIGGAK